jgi:hypothetical protein
MDAAAYVALQRSRVRGQDSSLTPDKQHRQCSGDRRYLVRCTPGAWVLGRTALGALETCKQLHVHHSVVFEAAARAFSQPWASCSTCRLLVFCMCTLIAHMVCLLAGRGCRSPRQQMAISRTWCRLSAACSSWPARHLTKWRGPCRWACAMQLRPAVEQHDRRGSCRA